MGGVPGFDGVAYVATAIAILLSALASLLSTMTRKQQVEGGAVDARPPGHVRRRQTAVHEVGDVRGRHERGDDVAQCRQALVDGLRLFKPLAGSF